MDAPPKSLTALLTALAFSVAVFFATYHLSESPAIWYDEGFYTQLSMNFAEGNGFTLQVAPGDYVSAASVTAGFPLTFPIAVSYQLFGVSVFSGRAVMAVFLLGFVVAAYVLARMLFGPWCASWTALLIAVFPMLYGNGKSVLGEVPGLFFLTLFLITLVLLERCAFRDARLSALAGVMAGLCVVTKPIFLLLVPAAGVAWLICRKNIPLSWGTIMSGTLAFLAPVFLWFFAQFGAGDSIKTVLSFYANPYEVTSFWPLVLGNALKFFTETTPIYVFIVVLLWSASLIVRRRSKTPATFAECVALCFSLATLLAFLRLPGWYRYLFPAVMVALIMAPSAGMILFRALRDSAFPLLARIPWLPYGLLSALILMHLYQLSFSSYVAQYYGGHRSAEASAALRTITKDQSIFLYNVPELAILLPHRKYYQYLEPHPENIIGASMLEVLARGGTDLVVTTAAIYMAEPESFSHYSKGKDLGRYVILVRQ